MKTTREVIWNLVYDLLPEGWDDELVHYEGIKKWEDENKDIVDSIEELAQSIEDHMTERSQYDDAKEDNGCRINHKRSEGEG